MKATQVNWQTVVLKHLHFKESIPQHKTQFQSFSCLPTKHNLNTNCRNLLAKEQSYRSHLSTQLYLSVEKHTNETIIVSPFRNTVTTHEWEVYLLLLAN